MLSLIRIAIKLFKMKTIVLMGYLILQLTMMIGMDAKPLNGAQKQTEQITSSLSSFPFPLPKDGTELSLFPGAPCDCGQEGREDEDPTGFVPSDKFPFEIIPYSGINSEDSSNHDKNDVDDGHDVEIISKTGTKRSEKLQTDPAKQDEEDSNVIKQVIFIEPPSYVYNHNIKVQPSQQTTRPRTVIYVFPPTVKHTYNISDKRDLTNNVKEEPQIYYLGAKHFENVEQGDNGLGKSLGREIPKTVENANNLEITTAYLPSNHMKRNLEITEESRKTYAQTKPEQQQMIKDNDNIIQSQSFRSSYEISTPSYPTTPPPPKQYRRFDYFSKTDYEKLKSNGLLSPNSVQYRIGPVIPPPPPFSSTSSPSTSTFTPSNFGSNYISKSTPVSPNAHPTVRLQYERFQHVPQANAESLSLLPPPPLAPTNDFLRPREAWQWGHVAKSDKHNQVVIEQPRSPNSYPYDNDQNYSETFKLLQIPAQNATMSKKPAGFIKFPEELDNQASGSELVRNNEFQIIPAVFRNYVYVGPTNHDHNVSP